MQAQNCINKDLFLHRKSANFCLFLSLEGILAYVWDKEDRCKKGDFRSGNNIVKGFSVCVCVCLNTYPFSDLASQNLDERWEEQKARDEYVMNWKIPKDWSEGGEGSLQINNG